MEPMVLGYSRNSTSPGLLQQAPIELLFVPYTVQQFGPSRVHGFNPIVPMASKAYISCNLLSMMFATCLYLTVAVQPGQPGLGKLNSW